MYQIVFDESRIRKVSLLPGDAASAAVAKRRREFLQLLGPVITVFNEVIRETAAEFRAEHPNMPSDAEMIAEEKERLGFLWIDFVREHTDDFLDCEANRSLLEDTILQRGEGITAETLEVAFVLEKNSLAPKPRLEDARPR
jgi:hypothetical protein